MHKQPQLAAAVPLANKVIERVDFDVGGVRFSTLKTNLQKFPESFFCERHVSAGEPVFIDRDPKYFGEILNYMRDPEGYQPRASLEKYVKVADEFRSYRLSVPPSLAFIPNSAIVSCAEHQTVFRDWFAQTTCSNDRLPWQRLYCGSRDGWSADDFHRVCDGKGELLIIVKSRAGDIYGGYCPISWQSNGLWQAAPEAWLFTLVNPHAIPPTRYMRKPDHVNGVFFGAHHDTGNYGFWFGINGSLGFRDNARDTGVTTDGFAKGCYIDTTGKGTRTFTGCEGLVMPEEIEVYSKSK